DEIVVAGVLQPQEFRRKRRDITGPIHAGDRKRFDQLVEEHSVFWSKPQTGRIVDLADKGEFAGRGRRQTPEFVQEIVVGVLDAGLTERARDVIALTLFDVKTDPIDAFRHIKIEHLAWRAEALGRRDGNAVERDAALSKSPDPGDGPVEGTAAGTAPPVDVVQPLRAVDADPDVHVSRKNPHHSSSISVPLVWNACVS